MYRKVDGFISLNKSGLDLIKKKTDNSGRQKFAHVFHPHYKNYYLNEVSRQKAREELGVPADKFVFLFLGQIRAYKNVTGLIKAFKGLKSDNTLLLIAGNVHEDIEKELKEHLENSEGIIFVDSFVKDEDLQLYFNCADVVVTPYNRIFNSGSAFLNLSFGKPTLAPDLWALAELKQIVGSRWIKTYDGQISAEILEKSMAEIINESKDLSVLHPDISYLDPEAVALETIAFYKSLLNV
ncbi:glycosyltransferase [Pontibacter silvestris]|uniref:Glycosyltransferase n=1 Tax=Pontibacter silvestris TaxID=2305183 RepID=A0ABW4WX11_9BACT|nr:glycosyltransferase [Pontibacter silvestris]MCC9138818.1 glycosyltransferase [Pontibacter silvestris]